MRTLGLTILDVHKWTYLAPVKYYRLPPSKGVFNLELLVFPVIGDLIDFI